MRASESDGTCALAVVTLASKAKDAKVVATRTDLRKSAMRAGSRVMPPPCVGHIADPTPHYDLHCRLKELPDGRWGQALNQRRGRKNATGPPARRGDQRNPFALRRVAPGAVLWLTTAIGSLPYALYSMVKSRAIS